MIPVTKRPRSRWRASQESSIIINNFRKLIRVHKYLSLNRLKNFRTLNLSVLFVYDKQKERNNTNKIENKPLLCYTKVLREKGNLHGGFAPDASRWGNKNSSFLAPGRWGVCEYRGAEGGKTDDAIPKTHYTSSGAVFYLRKEPAPTRPAHRPDPLAPHLRGFSTLFMKITH